MYRYFLVYWIYTCNWKPFFYTPVFRRDILWYGDVRVSVRPSDSPSGSPSASFPHFSPTCFDTLSWNFAYDFVLLYYRSSSSIINLRQSLWEFCPLWNLENWKCSFPHFSLTCFDILSWNFAYDFVLQYYRSSLSVINLRQLLWELCPFWNLEYWKYTVFRTFLFHALTYWAEILHMTLCYCITDQVRVSSICVSFMGVMPLLELRILEIHSFPHFSLTCFYILSWNFAYDFVLLYYRSSLSVVNLGQLLWELCPFWNLEYWKYTVFCHFWPDCKAIPAYGLMMSVCLSVCPSVCPSVRLSTFWLTSAFKFVLGSINQYRLDTLHGNRPWWDLLNCDLSLWPWPWLFLFKVS